jgi:hypothetical protein
MGVKHKGKIQSSTYKCVEGPKRVMNKCLNEDCENKHLNEILKQLEM